MDSNNRQLASNLLVKAAASTLEPDGLPFAIAHAAAGLWFLLKDDPGERALDKAIDIIKRAVR